MPEKIITDKYRSSYRQSHLLLLASIALGVVLRFTNLAIKPPWSDEWATIVFSLGHSFRTIPLDTPISLDELLQPLTVAVRSQAVVEHLMRESTHPPLYFLLSHWWLQLSSEGLVSIWWARSLSALLGVAAIPAMYCLGWLWFRNLVTAQFAAALMAVSPLAIYLSQEARHYTLAILWVIASLACLNLAVYSISTRTKLSFWVIAAWVVVNSLGLATHYFFALTLVAETMVLFTYWLRDWRRSLAAYWLRIYLAIVATLSGSLVWIFDWRGISDNQLTSWIFAGNPQADFFDPLIRLLIWWLTTIFILPVEGVPDWMAIISGVIALGFLIWSIPQGWRGLKASRRFSSNAKGIEILWRFWVMAIALILTITYIFGADLTLSARFQFIYLPAFLLLVAAILAALWQQAEQRHTAKGKRVAIVTLFLGFLGALTVINNFAYQKVERPELVVPQIVEANLNTPVIIATLHRTHGQTGEMMSLAWQLQFYDLKPRFVFAHSDKGDTQQATQSLIEAISEVPRPFQLWLVNFFPSKRLKSQGCSAGDRQVKRATGYVYQLYTCR